MNKEIDVSSLNIDLYSDKSVRDFTADVAQKDGRMWLSNVSAEIAAEAAALAVKALRKSGLEDAEMKNAEGGPADKAGLQANDIITAVDGTEISGKSDLSSIIADHAAGDKLTLSIYRQGQTLTLTVEIGEQTTSAIADQQDSQQSQSQQQTPGFFGFGG